MNPSSALFEHNSKTLQARPLPGFHSHLPPGTISLTPSRYALLLPALLTSVAVLALLTSQIPGDLLSLALLWTLGCVVFRPSRQCPWSYLIDEDPHWLLVNDKGSEEVRYKNTEYHSAYLLVATFITSSGRKRRVVVWRDAVTPAAFSWISARISLEQPDKLGKIVATSKA